MIDEYSAHQASGDAHEVRAILPADVTGIRKAEKRLVDERCCLQGMVLPLARHARAGEAAQLGFDQGHQLIECHFVAIAPGAQQPGYIVWCR